ncbi:MAG: hypothetical protein F9K40_14260, partial [Kofleriaceae bacterium]
MTSLLAAALAAGGCTTTGWVVASPPPVIVTDVEVVAPPYDEVWSVDVFYEELTEYGVWLDDPSYGRVFEPYGDDFAPYRDGRWVMTEHGFTWVSDEPFGWACYHYGRWMFEGRWRWVPDTEWAPAWVEWRETDDTVAWSPLPPRDGRWRPPRDAWRGARWNDVLAPDLRRRSLDGAALAGVFDRLRPIERHGKSPHGRRWA